MVELCGLMGGRTAAGRNPRGNNFTPEVAALKLVGAPKEHPYHGLGDGFHFPVTSSWLIRFEPRALYYL
jgi:hypothetical protein